MSRIMEIHQQRSIPIALNDAITKQQIKNGDQIMLIGFGGGLTWGGCIVSI